jgi:hypothetical protein
MYSGWKTINYKKKEKRKNTKMTSSLGSFWKPDP